MAGVFKSLDKSDVRITPFRTHKLWSENVSYTKIALTGSVSISSSFSHVQSPYATTIYTADPLSLTYLVVSGSSEILAYQEIDTDTFSLSHRSTDVVDFGTEPLIANKYIAGVLDDVDGDGPSRVVTICADQNTTYPRIDQWNYGFDNSIGTVGGTQMLDLPVDYVNRIDYFPFANATPVSRPYILVSHNQSGSMYPGLVAYQLGAMNKAVEYTYNIPYDDPSPPVPGSGLPGSGLDYRGDYYFAIPASGQTTRIHTLFRDSSTNILRTANLELFDFTGPPMPFASASYTTITAIGDPGEHATTGVVDVVSSDSFAYFTLKGQQNIYASSFDISLANHLVLGTPICRLLCDTDSVRYELASSELKFKGYDANNVVGVLEDGTILTNIKAHLPTATFTYNIVDARQYVGAGSKITNATINKNIDLVSSGSASLLYVFVESTNKGKSSMFVVNLDTEEILDPIHLGFMSNNSQPFFGTEVSGSTSFIADNRTTTVLGISQNVSEINPVDGVRSRYIYKFDVQ